MKLILVAPKFIKWMTFRYVKSIALWPFILVRHPAHKDEPSLILHERIHLRQQLEMFVLFFYIWYGTEFLIRLLYCRNIYRAYRSISFEREAYENECNPDYLNTRPFWFFRHYL